MLYVKGIEEGWPQVEQLGREWCVKTHILFTRMETLTQQLLQLGPDRKLWPDLQLQENITDYMLEEKAKLKDLLKSACYG